MKAKHCKTWAVAALGMFVVYIAAYAVNVRPVARPAILRASAAGLLPYGDTLPLEPAFRFADHNACRVIFSPLIRVDRGIRPLHWTYTETNHAKPFCAYQIELEAKWKSATGAATNK